MKIQLLSIGTEILLGDIINTNAAYLAVELANIGCYVYRQSVVGDNPQRLMKELEYGFSDHDVIITTGGLGPTDDDLSKNVVAQYFDEKLVFNQSVYDEILKYLKVDTLSSNNAKQAYVFENGLILHNENGTAPGLILQKHGKTMIMLPGPPREMKPLFNKYVIPFLTNSNSEILVSKYVRLFGIGESRLETEIKDILDTQTNPTLALYAKNSEVTIRITARGESKKTCDALIEESITKLAKVSQYIYSVEDELQSESTLHHVVASQLIEKNYTLSVSESLTGGYLSNLIVEHSGVSKIYQGGIVAYSNEIKHQELHVTNETLEKFGAVSEQCAYEMVIGTQKKFNTDIALSTTGIAGPTGGSDPKPIGLVYVGLYFLGEIEVHQFQLYGSRDLIKERASKEALNLIFKKLLQLK